MKLPESFEKDYLEALEPKNSDGAVKNRRNLLVASFSICSVYLLGKSLTDIKVLGINLEGTNKLYLLILAGILIFYWLTMYSLHSFKDFQLNVERRALLDKHIEKVKQQLDFYSDKKAKSPMSHYEERFREVSAQYDIYLNQTQRTNKAATATKVTYWIEIFLPFLFGLGSIIFLTMDLLGCFN